MCRCTVVRPGASTMRTYSFASTGMSTRPTPTNRSPRNSRASGGVTCTLSRPVRRGSAKKYVYGLPISTVIVLRFDS